MQGLGVGIGVEWFADLWRYNIRRMHRSGKIALPEGMQKIPAAMFHSCSNLRAIYIPVSVKVVESGAFKGCKNLKTVYYGGYLENWQAMYVKDNGSVLFNANVYGPCTASDLK